MRERACAIIICNRKMLFVEQKVNGKLCHVFIGGGVEEGETPREAVLRELREEANVSGEIVFGPASVITSMIENVFIVSISEQEKPFLGYDPELHSDEQVITNLIWFDIDSDLDKFNSFDIEYFSAILREGKKQNITGEWVNSLVKIIAHGHRL